MQYSLRILLLLVLSAGLLLTGYLAWERHTNTWIVDSPNAIGYELLRMEQSIKVGSEEPYIRETFGILIRNNSESRYLLWDNRSSPFELKNGDKIRLGAFVKERIHDTELNGCYANPEDIIRID